MNKTYIAVSNGFAYKLVSEHDGWIFRQIGDEELGFSGHYETADDAIYAVIQYGGLVITNRNVIVKFEEKPVVTTVIQKVMID